MALILGAEDLESRLALGEGRNEVGLGSLPIRAEVSGAQWLPLAETGVDDDAVESTEIVAEGLEHLENPIVFVHVERANEHMDIRIYREELAA
ncbi:MAG TPA: hypothetical protein VEX18_05420 [Polyangiaceae bacterium]|nr:hypothetical protein [Polyangiaceae bacterium]